MYSSRLELLKGALSFIARSSEEYVVLTDCDRICNMDYQKILDRHIESRADITIVTHRKKVLDDGIGKEILVDADMLGRIDDISEHTAADEGYHNVSMNVFVMRRMYLLNIGPRFDRAWLQKLFSRHYQQKPPAFRLLYL